MKRIKSLLCFLTLSLTIFLAGCAPSSVASNELRVGAENQIIAGSNQNKPATETIAQTPSSEPKSFFVVLSSVGVRNGRIELNDFWGHEENDDEAKLYPADNVEIDIMNCAGYLGSATTTYRMEGGMRKAKLIEKTVAKDAVEKIKQCESNNEMSGNKVFGIAPRDDKRKSIKINKVDTKKIYNSLIKDVTELKKIADSEKDTMAEITGAKGKLSLGEDNWTDLDGDGQIDLIEFHDTPCENENDTCTWIFRLIDGKWKDIDYVLSV